MLLRNRLFSYKKYIALLLAVIFIGSIGVWLLSATQAATPVATIESESGSIGTSAANVVDTSASGGRGVKFTKANTGNPAPSTGVWISKAEIMALPMSGAAWDRLKAAALGNWGSVNLADNNSTHDVYTLAGALYAARTGDAAITTKTQNAIMSVQGSGYARVLEMSRNITDYVIAADIVGLNSSDTASFKSFVSGLRTKALQGHSGGKNMYETAQFSANNWGSMSRAAMAAIDVYLGDRTQLQEIATTMRIWLGESGTNKLVVTSTSWRASAGDIGINRRGATIQGHNVDGVQPEDQRRTGEFSWPAAKGSYPWESLQGAIVAMQIMVRAGVISPTAGDNAMVRAYDWLYTVNSNPAAGDDTSQPWIANKMFGTNYPTPAASIGKNMGWTDWTHAK